MDKEDNGKQALILGAVEGIYSNAQVARWLGISERSVKRLKSELRKNGEIALKHGNSGRMPANSISENLRDRIASLKMTADYCDSSVAVFKDLLAEREGIKISYSALSGILKSAGLAPKAKDAGASSRKNGFGELALAVSRPYDWFGDKARHVLHLIADDATGRITGMYFCRNECAKGYIEALRQTIGSHGFPIELHAGGAGKGEPIAGREPSTAERLRAAYLGSVVYGELGLAMAEEADARHAMRRVERIWGVLQSRLPRWLEKFGAESMEQINSELRYYISLFNEKFSKSPQEPESSFVPKGDYDLDLLLAIRHKTATDDRGSFSFSGFAFAARDKPLPARKEIEFLFCEKLGFLAHYGGKYREAVFLGAAGAERADAGRAISPSEALEILVKETYYADLGSGAGEQGEIFAR